MRKKKITGCKIRRLAFAGAHSTGKTTLLDELVERLGGKKIQIIKNIARSVIKRGFPMEKNSTVDSFSNYIKDQLAAERLAAADLTRVLVSDRTVVDAFGYAIANKALPRPFVPEYFIEMLGEIARLEACYYDLYVYFPVEFPMEPDPFRPSDDAYRQAVGDAIYEALQILKINFIRVTGTTRERLAQLEKAGFPIVVA